ncbi:hypothetical protein [Actinomadura parmotrematis]|uniref:Uncharacterized protein n=1 Tax=Actinomadura parmotrematis TaxID=2864039 RepID=A0ABS7G216_9ACTN|nr:hypothetical protein [Actinomadura parmotrematis]MBW8486255.1 hypothetical protein [Actinomadura parmotrematis]
MPWYVVRQYYDIELPGTPIELWRSGELWEHVNAAEGAKVEVLEGDIYIDGEPRRPDPGAARARPLTVAESREFTRRTMAEPDDSGG